MMVENIFCRYFNNEKLNERGILTIKNYNKYETDS